MKNPRILFVFIVIFHTIPLLPQEIDRSDWMRYLAELANEDETDHEALADLHDELSFLAENPYNLLTITKQDLEKLPFLSALQIENILLYLYKYGPPVDLAELKNVEELDPQTIRYLLPFLHIGPPPSDTTNSLRNNLRYSRQELFLRAQSTLQKKAGYRNESYLGDPYGAGFRYRFNAPNLQFGLGAEKDAGEKGLDYTTFNLNFKQLGILEDLHLGNYRLAFGQGLVLNTNFAMGKTVDGVSTGQRNTGIQPHLSMNESAYFSGAAGTLRHSNLRLTLFHSNRRLDATADDSTIYTFQTDGLHQTRADLLKRKTAPTTLSGGHLQWQTNRWLLGLTALQYAFNGKTLNPKPQPYNLFYLRGKSHANAGLNYAYRSKRLHLQGEMAVDRSGHGAAIAHLHLRPASFVEGLLSFRHYDKQYNALYAKGFSESNAVRNETGYYAGLRLHLLKKLELSAYIDQFRFPWLRYGVDTPSSGTDILLRLKYNFRPHFPMELRYKYKEKQAGDLPYAQHRWRYRLHYAPRKTWETALQLDYTQLNYTQFDAQLDTQLDAQPDTQLDATPRRAGWSCSQTASYRPLAGKFRIDGGLLYFRTDDWASRVTVYETNLPYTFSFPSFAGHGLRYYTVIQWKILPRLALSLKCASTHYFDRSAIGSGPEMISGPEKTDVFASLKYGF